MTTRERRGAVRRMKAIRFRFDGGGQVRRAVTTDASATGLLLKATWVPALGTRLVLHERHDAGAPLHVVGEVVRTHPEPTLVSPETSFAIRLEEAWTRGDPSRLAAFVDGLAQEVQPNLSQDRREGGLAQVHRFGPIAPASRLHAEDAPAAATERPSASAEHDLGPSSDGVEVLWAGGKTGARVVEMSETLVRLETSDAVPPFYAWVQLRGAGVGRLLEGTVSRVGSQGVGGKRLFAVRTRTVHSAPDETPPDGEGEGAG